MEALTLRPADHADERIIFEWRNDPWIIARGISGRQVTWQEHQEWFRKTLKNPDTRIFIVESEGLPVGQVRLQRTAEGVAEITVYLMKDYTGRGLGVRAISLGCAVAFDDWGLRRVVAHILHGNQESRKAFEKAGFKRRDEGSDKGYLTMSLERNR